MAFAGALTSQRLSAGVKLKVRPRPIQIAHPLSQGLRLWSAPAGLEPDDRSPVIAGNRVHRGMQAGHDGRQAIARSGRSPQGFSADQPAHVTTVSSQADTVEFRGPALLVKGVVPSTTPNP